MIVMPSSSTGYFHCVARETGRLGHLYSPGDTKGPWPWFPYALDNGCFALWRPADNFFDEARWLSHQLPAWRRHLFWAQAAPIRPLWAVVPDRPGHWRTTARKWRRYAPEVQACEFPLALAVQDGSTPAMVHALRPRPDVIAVGGSTDWKWATAAEWLREFPRVHVLRVNQPDRLHWLESLGCMSCDGTGWNRGDKTQTRALEEWARLKCTPVNSPVWPFMSKRIRKDQDSFA